MRESSVQGVQVLRALAAAVRSEQDFELVTGEEAIVGALKDRNAVPSDAMDVKQRRGHAAMLDVDGYRPLTLRQALNKIVHADPRVGDFYVGPGEQAHDLLLYGQDRGDAWFAVISLVELITAIRALPDVALDDIHVE